ncbi:MAG: DNA polymerase III subunit delta [Gemmatimonadales bacterium]
MAPLSFDALLRRLRQGPPDPAYYLYGDEDVLKDEAIHAVLDLALDPAARDFNLDQRSAADLSPDALHTLVNTPPMLAERRAVVVRGVEQLKKGSRARDALVRYLSSPNPTTALILVQGADTPPAPDLAAGATAVELGRLAPDRVLRWVAHRSKDLGLTLEPEAVELLIGATDGDLTALAPELAKLAALAGDRPVTPANVTALVGAHRGHTVHDLVAAALSRRAAAAAQLVEPVLEQPGTSGVRIVTALGTALVGTALARAELDRGVPRAHLADTVFRHIRAARPFGLGDWNAEAARWAAWAEQWSATELRQALHRALDADRALKTSTVTADRGILEQLVLGFAAAAQEAA